MSKIQNGCLLFSSIGSRTPFPHSMSGPRSCVCSQVGACTPAQDEGNIVDLVLGVEREQGCRDLCSANFSCSVYTWYNASETLANTCFLMRRVKINKLQIFSFSFSTKLKRFISLRSLLKPKTILTPSATARASPAPARDASRVPPPARRM